MPCPLRAFLHGGFVGLFLSAATFARGAEQPPSFNRDIRPILSDNCFHCHGADEGSRKGKLRLDLRDDALRGGKSGSPAIVPGKPDDSELLHRVTAPHDAEDRMPTLDSKKPPLTALQIATLRKWIAAGAPYEAHWAFIPPAAPRPPSVASAKEGLHPIDALVSARLASERLALSPRADSATLARRLHLDLVGLTPSPAEIDAFVADATRNPQSAIATLTDRLLARETFGEKWARHWLDVARYSDSNGYEKDLPRQQWAWRDWVIDALNRDLPYNRFVIEQVAGDLLPDTELRSANSDLPSARQAALIATGFLRNSMINEEGAVIPEQFRKEEIFDRMDCLGKAVVGLTLQCAQCHTHKFDPISHDEYFSLFAFIDNSYEAQSWVYTADQHKQLGDLDRVIATLEARAKEQRPDWSDAFNTWESSLRKQQQQVSWTPLVATEMGSSSGLNHPTQERDGSILTLGHPTGRGSIYVIAEPELKGVTGLRLEALTHGDLPFGGPGRSKYGTWALSELTVSVQAPGSTVWHPQRLQHATSDYSEESGPLEAEWAAEFDKEKKRTRGPVAYLIDGKKDTGWRADRGPGRRNQDSVAVVRFECPLSYPPGTKLKIELLGDHGGSTSDTTNAMLGRCRIALTTTTAPSALPVDYAAILALDTPPEKRTPAQQRALFTAWLSTVPELKPVADELTAAWKKFPSPQTSILHLAERPPTEARETHLLDRGAWDRPKHAVTPRTPAALHPFPAQQKIDRLGFARWLVDPRSPLAARVAVNRTWQALFGAGLVETAEDFGTRAPLPEHLDLLDWLATDFMAHGWSHKHLVRTIVTSATYQQSSHATPALLERDPRNRLLARGPRFRLEAEVLRDATLSIAGLLHPAVGGPSFFPPVPQSVLDYNFFKPTYWKTAEAPERYRRALYMFRKRSMPDPVMGVFDAPNGDTACARRPRSNTPLAALTGLNETIFVEAAQALALRILREGGGDDAARSDYAYRLCTGRPGAPAEREKIAALLRTTHQRIADGWISARELATGDAAKLPALPPGATPGDAAAWTVVARVLLNLDETLTKS